MTMDVPSRGSNLVSAALLREGSPTALYIAHSAPEYTVRDALLIMDSAARVGTLHGASDVWATRHAIDIVYDAEQGVHLLEQRRYRLLVLDLGADGFNVLHILRMHPALRPPAVIVFGALDLKEQMWGAIEAGADDYLLTPCDMSEIVLRMELWLRRVGVAASNGCPGIHIHSLGHFRVLYESKLCLQETGRARKMNLLFKYLLTHHGRMVHTGEVFELIWPDEVEKVAATDLRSLLHQLRRMLGNGAAGELSIRHSVTTLGLQLGSGDWWDVQEFSAWMREAARWQEIGDTARALRAYTAAIDLYHGDFLCDDRYVEWITPFRERLREQWLKALAALAELHAARGEYEAQETALRTLFSADPYREHTLRGLMELLAMQGRGAEALVLYRKLRDLLLTELDAHPDPETSTLANYIGQRSR